MNKILIISATKGNNLSLAKKIGNYVSIDNKIISLEDFEMPLYVPKTETIKTDTVKSLSEYLFNPKALFSVHLNTMVDHHLY